jgi:hypothetical protein
MLLFSVGNSTQHLEASAEKRRHMSLAADQRFSATLCFRRSHPCGTGSMTWFKGMTSLSPFSPRNIFHCSVYRTVQLRVFAPVSAATFK